MGKLTPKEQKERENLLSQGLKKCSMCKEVKPVGEFFIHKVDTSGYSSRCKSCSKRYLQVWTRDHREWLNKYQREKYWKDPERRTKRRLLIRQWNLEARRKVFDALGGKCSVCGFSDPRALTVHHTVPTPGARNSVEYQRELQAGKELILLCANCHAIYHFEHGKVRKPR